MRSLVEKLVEKLLVAVVAVLLLAAGLGACVKPAGNGTGSDDHHAGHNISLVVQQDGRVISRFALPQLLDLPQLQIVTPQSRGRQIQKGPTVRSILNAAGATGVNSVRVEGRDPAQTLTVAELTDQLILNVTKRKTLKLVGAKLGTDRWVRDVTALVVNP